MDINNLKGLIPDEILEQLTPEFLSQATINGPMRLSHFLGQSEEESGKFTRETENLNYSADGLMKTFGSHFRNRDVNEYAHNPEKIANLVYANRMGNGDESSGDGWKYRGRGDLETTGHDNYLAFQNWLNKNGGTYNIMDNPDLLAQPEMALLSAAYFFTSHNLWVLCDKGIDVATITIITEHVNGGTLGLQDRIMYTQALFATLGK